jgi:periplasmic protein TonB
MIRGEVPVQPDGKAELLSANERFKRSFTTYFWGALILATGAHFAVLDFWPAMTAVDVSSTTGELTAIELPPEIQIPEPPEVIPRPAVPVVVPGVMDEDLTIPLTTFQANPVADLPAPPPPPNEALGNLADAPRFTPYTVRPSILNREEVTRSLEREYPSLLRDAGIGGTVLVWFFIDQEGTLQRTQVHESSGHRALDEAALRVADVIRFSPALNRDKQVPVWISLPITFTTR